MLCVLPAQTCCKHHQKSRNPRRNIVCNVIQLCCRASKVQIPVIFIADHAVHRIDRFIAKSQRRTSDHQIKKRCCHTVRKIFRHRLNRSLCNSRCVQILRIPSDNSCHRAPGAGQILLFQLFFHPHALCIQSLHRKRLPTPQRFQQKCQHGMHQTCQINCGCRHQKASKRQNRCQGCSRHQKSLLGIRKLPAQKFFQRADCFSHINNRVRHPVRIPQAQIHEKAA